jgi:type IV fimbrial biogenesis protein FimT
MNRQLGFTLTELIVTVAIAAILLTVGVPSFQSMIRNNRAATHMNEMISALNLARSEAAKLGRRVSLCPSTDQASCTGGTNWNSGWIVFTDTSTNDSTVTVGMVLRVGEALTGAPTLTGPTSVRYRFTGGTLPDGTSVQFNYALDTVTQLVCVSPVGRPRVEKVATSCP